MLLLSPYTPPETPSSKATSGLGRTASLAPTRARRARAAGLSIPLLPWRDIQGVQGKHAASSSATSLQTVVWEEFEGNGQANALSCGGQPEQLSLLADLASRLSTRCEPLSSGTLLHAAEL